MRMKKLHIITLLFLALLPLLTEAQNATMNIHARETAAVGQAFQITFEVNDEARNFKVPTLKGLNLVGGPYSSRSSYSSYINGRRSNSISYTFTILVEADKVGTANVGAASCIVNGKTVTSKPFSIKIVKAEDKTAQGSSSSQWNRGGRQPFQPQRQAQPQRQTQPQTSNNIDHNTLFARASINKTNLYKGEEAIIVYKIYTQIPLTQFQIEKLPRNKGFWSEDLSEGRTQVRQYSETVNGRQYQVAEIRRGALYPQETGTLRIEPLKTDVVAIILTQMQRQRTGTMLDYFIDNFFDDPFFAPMQQQAVVKSLTSNALSVNVKPLPESPAGFAGGVGHFDISVKSDLNELRAGEALTYSITISGRGNLSLLEPPQINFPQGFEVYEPRIIDNITKTDNGLTGSRTFEWIITPQSQGKFQIPSVDYVYFDPSSETYVTKHSDPINVNVLKGASGSVAQGDVRLLNSDIHHIRKTTRLHPIGYNVHTGLWFWLLLLLPIVAVSVIIAFARRQQRIASDESSMRLQRATKLAKKRLRNAEKALNIGNDELFYEEIYKALWGGIADKFNIQQSLLSSETIKSHLEQKNVENQLKERILQTLTDVDFARFAPGDSGNQKQNIYQEAMQTIIQIGSIKIQTTKSKNETIKTATLILLAIVLSYGNSIWAAQQNNANNPDALFLQANEAYDTGDYEQALSLYNAVIEAGYESADLYYNIGNTYYRLEEIGYSILYERALRLKPSSKEIKENLMLARSKTADKIEEISPMFLVSWFKSILSITTPRGWRTILIIIVIITCIAAAIFFISSNYKTRKAMFIVSVPLLLLIIFSALNAAISARNVTNNKEAIVIAPMVVVKGSPDQKSVDKFVLHEGTKLAITDRQDQW